MATPEPASAVGMSREALNQAATRARAIPACDPTDCSLIPRPTINHSGEPLGDLAIQVLRGVLVQLGSYGGRVAYAGLKLGCGCPNLGGQVAPVWCRSCHLRSSARGLLGLGEVAAHHGVPHVTSSLTGEEQGVWSASDVGLEMFLHDRPDAGRNGNVPMPASDFGGPRRHRRAGR